MANTSDGNRDPPDPPNARMNTDALSLDSPSVHRANNDSIPTEIDQDFPITATIVPTSLLAQTKTNMGLPSSTTVPPVLLTAPSPQ
mmetsp:Transcript_20739/g.43414  ORF Transcript_20739/g.43414 Transcript_20739/m.43414 type:complete len:86 (+) Transcript_20739:316-573(+)